jgi:hypothetical protein
MNYAEYRGVPRSTCEPIINLVKAAVDIGIVYGPRITEMEATDVLVSEYHGWEMLFDGKGWGLVTPWSERWCPIGDEALQMKMCDAVSDLWNLRSWRQSRESERSIKLDEAEGLLLLTCELPSIWGRMCDVLFGGKYKDDYFEAVASAERRDREEFEPTANGVATVAPISGSEEDVGHIQGPTFARLKRAIAAFPARYPHYSERFPKLDSDLRPWLLEAEIAANEREAYVFSRILSEHFAASPDTLKP